MSQREIENSWKLEYRKAKIIFIINCKIFSKKIWVEKKRQWKKEGKNKMKMAKNKTMDKINGDVSLKPISLHRRQ